MHRRETRYNKNNVIPQRMFTSNVCKQTESSLEYGSLIAEYEEQRNVLNGTQTVRTTRNQMYCIATKSM